MDGLRRHAVYSLAAIGVALGIAGAKAAEPVDLELVLAVDTSGSIDFEEAQLQRQGYIAALSDDRVIATILSGPLGRIALAYVEWGGAEQQNDREPDRRSNTAPGRSRNGLPPASAASSTSPATGRTTAAGWSTWRAMRRSPTA